MFPVLVAIPNDQEVLKPGMNADVEISIARHQSVLSIPNEAVKTPRDAATAAVVLGLSADDVREVLGSNTGSQRAGDESRSRSPGGGKGGRSRRENVAIVFRSIDDAIVPVRVILGVANWDYTEVKNGLAEGDKVVVLPSASLLKQQQEFRDRMRGVSGMPGMGGGGGGRPRL